MVDFELDDAAVAVMAADVPATCVTGVSDEVINWRRVSMSSLKCSLYFLFVDVSPLMPPSPSGLSSSDAFSLLLRLFRLPVVLLLLLLAVVLLLGTLLFRMKLLNLALLDEVMIGVGAGTADAANEEDDVPDVKRGDASFTLLLLLSKW